MHGVSRRVLARLGEQRVFSKEAMDAALDLSGLRPGAEEGRKFALAAMHAAGALSLAAGMVFLVAINWRDLGLYGRFAMVEVPLLAALAVAWIQGVARLSGRLALLLAVILTGVLLALFGQTYQTGANLYELFLGWAALTLPWVIACRWAPCWGLWLLLVNVALMLIAQAAGRGDFLSGIIWDRQRGSAWALGLLVDSVFYAVLAFSAKRRDLGLSAQWLQRGVAAAAMVFGTIMMLDRITSSSRDGAAVVLEILLFLATAAGFAVYAYLLKSDLFNFAALALSLIVVTTAELARMLMEGRDSLESLLILGCWVILASTGSVMGISNLAKQWRKKEGATV
jgi:uncharacterized membrane protein